MNCKRFEIVIMELAREAAMAADARRKLHEHVNDCPECAAQVAGEQSLTLGLRTLAGSSKREVAPPRVEMALKAAFRKQAGIAAPPSAPLAYRDLVMRSGIGLAAAAVVLVSFLAPGLGRVHPGAKLQLKQEGQAPSRSEKLDGSSDPAPAPNDTSLVDRRQYAVTPDQPGSGARKPARHAATPRGGDTFEAIEAGGFIPLVYGEELNPLEGGQVVRVKLPRSMLASFGFAVNMEVADEPVRADVVLGNDGVLRSIRLIDGSVLSR